SVTTVNRRRLLRGSSAAAAMALGLRVPGLALARQDGAPAACPAEIVIGVIAPVTGSKAEQGQQFTEGAEVAVNEINEAGGVNGSLFRLEILDDQGLPNEAVAAAQKLVSNNDVFAVIGPSSTASSSAAIPVLERAQITTISPSASTPSLVTDNQHFYIMSLPLSAYGPLVPQFAAEKFGAEDLAIIHVKDDWGENVTSIAKEWSDANGVPIVAEANYTQGDRDFKAQLTAMLDKDPDALVLNTHYTEGALITRQARELGYEGPIVAQGTNVYPQFIELAEDAAEGVVGWTDFLASLDTEPVQQTVEKFQQAIGKEPLQYHVSTYDAVKILAQTLSQVGCNREVLSTTVGQTQDFPGLVGPMSFNAERLPEKELFWVEVKDGQWALFPDA
ncbi:MAG: ABC transporter substrate-binding protein, partial [Thermomicrobiales bacterium]